MEAGQHSERVQMCVAQANPNAGRANLHIEMVLKLKLGLKKTTERQDQSISSTSSSMIIVMRLSRPLHQLPSRRGY